MGTSGSSGTSGMIHQSNPIVGGKSASSVSESKPTIGFLDSEFTEAGNSNTVFIQHRGSAASNGMLNSGSANNYGMQNSGSSGSNEIQNQGSSSNGMQGMRYESAGYY